MSKIASWSSFRASPWTPLLLLPPEKKSAPKNQSRRAFRASATLARRRLFNNKPKFESRTGQNVAAASAASNTERAIERGGRAAAERLLRAARQQRDEAIGKQKKAEKEAAEKTRECKGHVNLVRDLTCEKEVELRDETARRMRAEGETLRAERDKERAIQKQREAEEKSRKMKEELRSL